MACDDCEKKSRLKALAYLTGIERRKYLLGITMESKTEAMQLVAAGIKRVSSDLVLCHSCGDRCMANDSQTNNYHKYHDLVFCAKCFEEIANANGYFCCSCFETFDLSNPSSGTFIYSFTDKFKGAFLLCKSCIPDNLKEKLDTQDLVASFDIVSFLGGYSFVPDQLRSFNAN